MAAAAVVATLAFLVWHLGTGPFLDGLQAVDGGALAAASGLAVLTTVCCAWRWRTVARGLGADLPLGTAVAAYYRSLFLNVTLPGGVVGDVHRGSATAPPRPRAARRGVGALRRPGRADRPHRRRAARPAVARAGRRAARRARAPRRGGRGGARAARAPRRRRSRWGRLRGAVARDLRDGLLARRAWPAVALASALVVAGHAVTFLIAARTAGVTAPASQLLPLALLVLLAAALPNIGGWGPREGVTAWAFAAAGLGASLGVTTAVVYGVMVFFATLPGAAVLVADSVHRGGAAHV